MSLLLLLAAGSAQAMDHSKHGAGMQPPAQSAAAAEKPAAAPADPACSPEHAAMGHCTPKAAAPAPEKPASAPADPDCPPEHAAMGHCTPKAAPAPVPSDTAKPEASGTALPAGDGPAPAAPEASYADRVWGRAAMEPVRVAMKREHGGASFSQIMLDIAEVRFQRGREGYAWGAEGWFGGDINRLVVKTEGEGSFGEAAESVEVEALYSRAIGPYFNLQAGVRHDFKPSSRTYATIGFEGLAPYWFELEGALFLSDKGDLFARIGGYYDQRVTQRLILQPRAEFNLAAQDVPADDLGSGLTDAEIGVRLRYEVVREFAPYVGVSWERKFGDTARFARAEGEGTGGFSFVAGIRAWF